jgi:Sec-independent protein translocase protein TatA
VDFLSPIFKILKEGQESGLAVDLILMVVVIALVILGFLFIRRKLKVLNEQILKMGKDFQKELTEMAEENSKTNEALIKTLSELSVIITQSNDAISNVALTNERTLMTLKSMHELIGGDETITEGQAVIVYESLIKGVESSIVAHYKKTEEWLNKRDVIEDESLNKQLKARFFNHFDALRADLNDSLSCFKFDGKTLLEYQSTVENQWRHIACNLYATLVSFENGVEAYASTSFDVIRNYFNQWLKDGIGFKDRKEMENKYANS